MKRKFHIQLFALGLFLAAGLVARAQDSTKSDSPAVAQTASAPAPAAEPILSDSALQARAANIALGKALFEGSAYLANGGPSCITCHNAKYPGVAPGGLLAKDLTFVNSRLGVVGVGAILSSTPFPAMATAYKSKPLNKAEIDAIATFLEDVDKQAAPTPESAKVDPAPNHTLLLLGGGAGLVVWLGFISLMYVKRRKQSVKQDIFARQQH